MEDDEADLKKMIEVLNSSKQTSESGEFNFDDNQDFSGSEDSDLENELNETEIIEEYGELFNVDKIDVFSVYKHDPISSLKPEEKQLIDQCNDQELKHLLFLNRKKNINLILLYKKLQDLLMECRQYIIEKAVLLKEHVKTMKANNLASSTWKLAAPYFKDKDLYQSPMNDDTKRKMSNNELFIYEFRPNKPWSQFECEKLVNAVKLNYSFNKQQAKKAKLRKNAKQLVSQAAAVDDNDTFITEIPPLNSNKHLNWTRIASVFLQDKHSEMECQSTWHLLLHPSINKSSWTTEENDALKKVAKKYKFQNWKAITSELGNNRSEYLVCKHFLSNLTEKFKKGEFSYEEDKKILEMVQKYKTGSYIHWNRIARHFHNRTRGQLYHRYCYYLSHDSKKKGSFTRAEDIVLMIYVDRFGRKFSKVDKYLSSRSSIQCKARYANSLQRTVPKGNWTLEEDQKVEEHVKNYGTQSWSKLSKEINRTRGQLRQRYVRIKTFRESKPGADLSAIPRKKVVVADADRYEFCRSIADKYSGSKEIPTVEEIEKLIKNETVDEEIISSHDDDSDDGDKVDKTEDNYIESKEVDQLLLNFFSNSFKTPSIETINDAEYQQGIDDIDGILTFLKANLTIPNDFETIHEGYLDPIDIRILRCLKVRKTCDAKNMTAAGQKLKSIRELIPPHFHSTIGMRSLLIKHLRYDCRSRDLHEFSLKNRSGFSAIRQKITNDIVACSDKERRLLENERNLFYRRFHSLFKWPALLTIEDPSSEISNVSDFLPVKKFTSLKRTYSRVEHDENDQQSEIESDIKKIKTTSTSTSSSNLPVNVIKLRPVSNKSVISDLMKNKSKKLFSVEKIKENGRVKTVISEIKLDFNKVLGLTKRPTASVSENLPTLSTEEEQSTVDCDGQDKKGKETSASSATTSSSVSSAAVTEDLPLVVIKGDYDENNEMLDMSSDDNDEDCFDIFNTVEVETKDSVLMEMSSNRPNGNNLDQFYGNDDMNIGQDNEDEDKCDLEKINQFLRENALDSSDDSDINESKLTV